MKLFLSLDWGTSSLRIRLIETDFENIVVLHELQDNLGISSVHRSWAQSGKETSRLQFYIQALEGPIKFIEGQYGSSLGTIPLVVSGMASSSIGMCELPYSTLPLDLDGSNLGHKKIDVPWFPHPILLISGVRGEDDIMRGEETQLLGCHDTKQKKDSIYIFPGTHSKHIQVREAKAIAFKTYMTGELFHLLAEHSILKDNVEKTELLSEKDFICGLRHARTKDFLGSVFRVRTNQILHEMDKGGNHSFLSGLLIGHEIMELSKNDFHIYLCPHKKLSKNYTLALEEFSLLDRATVLFHGTVDQAVVQGQILMLKNQFPGWN